ncbi:MAG TPA: hypothetical protein VG759_02075 [Candidatus Angelobacter sp.]|nr:hypothetical protein [Candidatus Angelobacter sp.]
MTQRFWLPVLLLSGAIAAAIAAHLATRSRRSSGDCGDYWEKIVRLTCYWLGIPLLLSTIAESISSTYWLTGWHLQFDRVLGHSWAFPLALAIPFVLWVLFLLTCLRLAPKTSDHSNWLAGAIGFSASRKWVLHSVWILIIPLLWWGPIHLDSGRGGYPAATWSTLAVLVISLVGIAFSASASSSVAVSQTRTATVGREDRILPDWPEAMEREGIDLQSVTKWNASSDMNLTSYTQREADEFAERLALIGARAVAPQIIELFHQLKSALEHQNGLARKCVLFSPDNCGQVEALALAASDLLTQSNEVTLVIVPPGDPSLLSSLRFWLSSANRMFQHEIEAVEVTPGVDLSSPSAVWVVDAATLSDDFMTRLADPEKAQRIGFVVWWNLHAYSGVMAANVWAVSRRLHRILVEHRGTDLLTLAVVRNAFHADAELPAFVRRLLPYTFEQEVHVGRFFSRTVHLHRLSGQRRYFGGRRSEQFAPRCRHLPLVAAHASASLGWPTNLDIRIDIPKDEREQVFDILVSGRKLGMMLSQNSAEAGAQILSISAEDTLSLIEIVSQGGRAAAPELPHNVGLVVSENPYVNYLIDDLGRERTLPGSRRLIVAEGHESVFRRHLLLALNELEDTRSGLLHAFRWEESVIENTLHEIAIQNRLSRAPVRYLNDRNDLILEQVYRSRLGVGSRKRPLDTVGEKLIVVRDVDAPADGVRMQVDPERLVIQAYPQRIFISNGLRYRVRDWDDRGRGWVACIREASHAATWRIRSGQSIIVKKKVAQDRNFGYGGVLKSFPVTVEYREWFDGVLRREYDLTNGPDASSPAIPVDYPSTSCSFETKALILQFLPNAEPESIRALCLALRYVIPVHVGVEEDALEVIPLIGQMIQDERVDGLAIVDLYPQGIGLADAIYRDQQLVQNILEWTWRWLIQLVRQEQASPGLNGLHSPLAIATGGDQDANAALGLLRRLVNRYQTV